MWWWKTKIDGELIFIQLSIILVQSTVSTKSVGCHEEPARGCSKKCIKVSKKVLRSTPSPHYPYEKVS